MSRRPLRNPKNRVARGPAERESTALANHLPKQLACRCRAACRGVAQCACPSGHAPCRSRVVPCSGAAAVGFVGGGPGRWRRRRRAKARLRGDAVAPASSEAARCPGRARAHGWVSRLRSLAALPRRAGWPSSRRLGRWSGRPCGRLPRQRGFPGRTGRRLSGNPTGLVRSPACAVAFATGAGGVGRWNDSRPVGHCTSCGRVDKPRGPRSGLALQVMRESGSVPPRRPGCPLPAGEPAGWGTTGCVRRRPRETRAGTEPLRTCTLLDRAFGLRQRYRWRKGAWSVGPTNPLKGFFTSKIAPRRSALSV